MTRALVNQGCEVVGVELDPEAAVRAKAIAQQVIVGDLDQPGLLDELQEGRFDVVLAGDILEHLRDPLALLRRCRPLLATGGTLVASIPNVAHGDVRLQLVNGEFPYGVYGLLDATHLRFFTFRTIQDLLHAAGFVPVRWKRVIAPLFASELAPDRDHVNPALVEQILADPEAETYQFVVLAVLDDGNLEVHALADRVESLAGELRIARAQASQLRERLEGAATQLGRADERLAELTDRLTQAEVRAQEADAVAREAVALQQTRLFRYSAPARHVYSRIRRICGLADEARTQAFTERS
jgi:SAM-dependent methyltransferase